MRDFSIAILGAGRLAHSLAAAINSTGEKIGTIYSKTLQNAESLALQFNIPHYTDSLEDIPGTTTRYYVTAADSAIQPIAEELSKTSANLYRKHIIHFSGSLSSSILSAPERQGALTGSMHILQSFPSKQIIPLKNSAAGIESKSQECILEMQALASLLQLKPFLIDADHKALYHVLGILVSNFITGNLAAAEELFYHCGITGISFTDLAIPIATQTLENARLNGVANSLSGPVERNDGQTIANHIDTLKNANGLHYSNELFLEQTKYLVHVARLKNPLADYSALLKIIRETQHPSPNRE